MKLLDGKKVSNKIKDELKPRINLLIQINNRPGLGIILVGDNIEIVDLIYNYVNY